MIKNVKTNIMKTLYSLKNKYVQVNYPSQTAQGSFGGSQLFFRGSKRGLDKYRESSGCGIVAINDVLAYLKGQTEYRDIEAYKKAFNKAARLTFWIPVKFGLSFIQQTFGLWLQMRLYKLPYKNRWGFSKRKLFSRMSEMLEADIPVILCIPRVHGKKAKTDMLPFYNDKGIRVNAVNGHFVVVTAMAQDEETEKIYLEVSSWGVKYYIDYAEYVAFLKHHINGYLGNIMYIRLR